MRVNGNVNTNIEYIPLQPQNQVLKNVSFYSNYEYLPPQKLVIHKCSTSTPDHLTANQSRSPIDTGRKKSNVFIEALRKHASSGRY